LLTKKKQIEQNLWKLGPSWAKRQN